MQILKYKKIFFVLSTLLFILSIYSVWAYGLNLGIDFKGGTITEVSFAGERPTHAEVEEILAPLELGNASIRTSGENNYIIRSRELSVEEGGALVQALGNPEVERQNTIGPVAGAELQSKAVKAIVVVVVMILIFITFAFRKVSKPVAAWKYALATILALLHDVFIPIGLFAFLGHLYGIEIDLLFASGLLAILGYSVHDTIVVFDRVRENLSVNNEKGIQEEFETTVGKSLSQTFVRSMNTSVTIMITLIVLYYVGSTATRDFSLLLIVGVIVGTYSSIFMASPLLVSFYNLTKK